MRHPEQLGKYAITGLLGEGAMGVVYKGFDPGIGRHVAIKTIRKSASADRSAQDALSERFRNEARAVGRLNHPGIVAIYDLGSDVIQWIFDELRRTAPVLTGAFKESIAGYVDGAEVSGPPAIPPGAREVVFVATVPYARKIERGQSRMAKDGVFEAVSALARRRFGNIANIRFSYRSPLGGDTRLEKWARAKNRAKRGQAARDRRQPAIIVSFR